MRKFAWLLLLCFVFTGCSSGETPEKAVTNTLNAIKNLNYEEAQKYIVTDELLKTEGVEDKYVKYFVENISFKIISSAQEGDTATVKTEITNIDFRLPFGAYIEQSLALTFENVFSEKEPMSQEEIQKQTEQILINELEKAEQTVTTTVDIKLTKDEKGWRIDLTEELQDAILGGLMSIGKELEKMSK
jgi:hypothetical protein